MTDKYRILEALSEEKRDKRMTDERLIEEIRKRHGVESAMDVNDQYSEWSQPALAARLRQSNRGG